ncbi:conserved hypothetical protein [Verticillium alfalfae VaMs.102]|uniref:Uncharacterized protein n=1 Tax=Verticillium alfalfae (strain VaMs.102 / ATCC MYA-4576 / FGSC 10136) TaxID=526221 RepID=C9SML9_VERA1|nr:conserved hypothetical protein [Verticillium alfalfae VaMs.102]EEY20034.1 conserved hypothetical protein [Verticillium alfalfae VaMs.102]
MALDTVQDIWVEYEEARPLASKYLNKFRPAFVESATRDAEEASAPVPAPVAAVAT